MKREEDFGEERLERDDVTHVDLHRRSLLNQLNPDHQPVTFFFAEENPVHS